MELGEDKEAQQEQVVHLEAHAPWLQQSSPDLRRWPERSQQHVHVQHVHVHVHVQHVKPGLLELQECVVLRSENAATACSGSESTATWCLHCSLLSWPLCTARPVCTAPEARVIFLQSCYIVWIYCMALLHLFHVNND